VAYLVDLRKKGGKANVGVETWGSVGREHAEERRNQQGASKNGRRVD
jgi:hypothetical protein